METLETLARRIETTEDIQSIVRTMKSLSTVSIRQYEQAVEAMQAYARTIELGLKAVLGHQGVDAAIDTSDDGMAAVIVLGSDRGLCGRFNDRVVDFARAELAPITEKAGARPAILAVGARTAARLETLGWTPDEVFPSPGSANGLVRIVHAILIRINDWREEKELSSAHLFFNRRTAESLSEPTRRRLLPPQASDMAEVAGRAWPSRGLPFFRADPADLRSWLVREQLFVDVFRAGAESLSSEHASRLSAMQAADRNISERLDELAAAHRTKRQETITTELMDIVAGFEAVRARG